MDLEHNKAVVQDVGALENHGGEHSRLDAPCTPDMVNQVVEPQWPAWRGRAGSCAARCDVHGACWVSFRDTTGLPYTASAAT
jgi:hypothetical protein